MMLGAKCGPWIGGAAGSLGERLCRNPGRTLASITFVQMLSALSLLHLRIKVKSVTNSFDVTPDGTDWPDWRL